MPFVSDDDNDCRVVVLLKDEGKGDANYVPTNHKEPVISMAVSSNGELMATGYFN